jgi:uncharacterized protein (TIGR03000 family)
MRSMLLSAVVALSAFGLALAGPAAARADEAPAVIRVTLPADATLTIDGQPTTSTSADRTFVTPPLEAGKTFHYELKAVIGSGENKTTIERRVAVRAGQQTNVALQPAAADDENYAYYYSPGVPTDAPARDAGPVMRYDLNAPPVRGYVGGARDNWKPDFSDPFLHSDNW